MQDRKIDARGTVVYWSPGDVDQQRINAELEAIGLEEFRPSPRTDAGALRAALEDYCDHMTTVAQRKADKVKQVQPHKGQNKNGFEVVTVDRKEEYNAYSHDFSARVEDGRVVVVRGWADSYALQQMFDVKKETLTGASVGQSLVGILKHLHGTACRPSGGMYWVLPDALEVWTKVKEAVRRSSVVPPPAPGSFRCYTLTLELNDDTLCAVRDSIVADVLSQSAGIREEVQDSSMGEVALDNRKQDAKKLHERISKYESFLGETLDSLHSAVTDVQMAITVASLRTLGVA